MKSIVYGDRFVGLSDAFYITLVSIGIVFLVLILICLFVSCMKFIPKAKEAVEETKKIQKPQIETNSVRSEEKAEKINYEDENIRLVIMVASMEAAQEDENAWIRVRSVREIV